jgi:hypothetical protein
MTEDSVRFAVALALEAAGVAPSRVVFEHRIVGIGPIDVAVDPPALTAVMEIKFPRDPKGTGENDTMTVGELINDFYRLGRLEARDRWALQVLDGRLARHLSRRRDVVWTAELGATITLDADLPGRLPKSARDAIRAWQPGRAVVATCTAVEPIERLTLAAYRIN